MLFLNREEGQGLVEYALILLLIAIVVIAIFKILAYYNLDLWNIIQEQLTFGVFK